MLATILGFLTALFNNGGGLLKQIASMVRGNPQAKKEKIDNAAKSEEESRDQGGRPQW